MAEVRIEDDGSHLGQMPDGSGRERVGGDARRQDHAIGRQSGELAGDAHVNPREPTGLPPASGSVARIRIGGPQHERSELTADLSVLSPPASGVERTRTPYESRRRQRQSNDHPDGDRPVTGRSEAGRPTSCVFRRPHR
jgi:hypothetical protein